VLCKSSFNNKKDRMALRALSGAMKIRGLSITVWNGCRGLFIPSCIQKQIKATTIKTWKVRR